MSKKISGNVLSVQLGREETQLVLLKDGTQILHAASVATPAGAVEDGMIRNPDAIREMLKDVRKDPAFKKSAKWRNIPEWSETLERYCKENNILFANCDALAEEHPKLWDPDGIHFREDFYPYWASNLVVATLMEGA
jgi:hypothetical protein